MPTREGLVALALAGFFFLLATNLMAGWLYFLDAFLVALLLVGAASAWSAATGATAGCMSAPPVTEGEEPSLPIVVEAHRFIRFLRVEAAVGAARGFVFLPALRRGTRTEAQLRLPPLPRGVHRLDRLFLVSRGVVGLFRVQRIVGARGDLLVRPRYRLLSVIPGAQTASGALTARHRRRGPELVGVREYHLGDPARHIHWRSTARRGQLVVKEFEETEAPALVVFVDTDRRQGRAALDGAARAAASIIRSGLDRHFDVTLAAASANAPVAVQGSWHAMWDALARLEPDGPPLPEALAALRGLVGEGQDLVAVSALAPRLRGWGGTVVGPGGSGAAWEFDDEGDLRWAGT